jgi:peptide/nickel transport system substrate-binding protein
MGSFFNKIGIGARRSDRKPRASAADARADHQLVRRLKARRLPTLKQLKHLPRFLTERELGSLKLLFVVAVLSFFAAAATFISARIETVPASGGEYVEAAVGGVGVVNPILVSNNDVDLDLVHLVFSGLMRVNAAGELEPDLAEDYRISDDGLIYTFKLRDDARWHDGEPVRADDVVKTIEFVKDPAWQSPYHPQFKNVAAEATDDLTVQLTLPSVHAPFLSYLTLGILPAHLWQQVEPSDAARAEWSLRPVGSGPFKFKTFTAERNGSIKAYAVSRNDDFYGDVPYLNSVTFKFYADFTEAAEALAKRSVDGISYLPNEYTQRIEQMRTVDIHRMAIPQYTALFFNLQNADSAIADKNVRLALSEAIDKPALLEALGRDAASAVSIPIMPWQFGYDAAPRGPAYDPEHAAALLDEAGWKLANGFRTGGSVADKESEQNDEAADALTVTITTIDSSETVAAAQYLSAAWGKLGVRAELEVIPPSRFAKEKLRPRDYEILLYGEITGYDADPYPFWHSSQISETGLNLSSWKNAAADEALIKARTASVVTERQTAYTAFLETLSADLPATFLYSPMYRHAVSRRFHGQETAIIYSPADRFSSISEWYVETRRAWR